MITEEEYKEAIKQKDAAQSIITRYGAEKQKRFDERMKTNPIFTDEELIYSADTLCPCGHGIAYPAGCSPWHYWDCSAILKGIADKNVQHTARLDFTCYEIKCEQQPSARGLTTRGVFKPKVSDGKCVHGFALGVGCSVCVKKEDKNGN